MSNFVLYSMAKVLSAMRQAGDIEVRAILEQHIGAAVLYFLPSYILFYLSAELYVRNPRRAENRLAALVLLMMAVFIAGGYLQTVLPLSAAAGVTYWIICPAALLEIGFALHFYMMTAKRSHRLQPNGPVMLLLCYWPLPVYAAVAAAGRADWFFRTYEAAGLWKMPVYGAGFTVLLAVLAGYNVAYLILLRGAIRSAKYPEQRRKYKVLQVGALLACVAIILFSVLGYAVPALRPIVYLPYLVANLSWASYIRWATIKYDIFTSFARKYEILFNHSPSAVLLLDKNAAILEMNPAAKKLFRPIGGHYSALSDYVPEPDRAAFDAEYRKSFRSREPMRLEELHMTDGAGGTMYVLIDSRFLEVDGYVARYVIIRDITERKQAERHILHLAYHDTLTGLPNRLMIRELLEEALRLAKLSEEGSALSVMLLDLDNFKVINDSLGHQAGDQLLANLTGLFKSHLGPGDSVGRLGGDEFIFLLRGSAEEAAGRLLQALSKPVEAGGQEFTVSASIGISRYPEDGCEPDLLIKCADIAMYSAKEQGRNGYRLFDASLIRRTNNRLELEQRLRKALKQNELFMVYQPQIDIATGETTGMEALVRWRSEDGVVVSPAEFVPIAEESGLIVQLGEWVLRRSCMEAKRMNETMSTRLTVSVNVSGKQFQQEDFTAVVKGALAETGLPPHLLCLEITESTAVRSIDHTLAAMQELIDCGVTLSIDDFGTGYSSLAQLKRFPIDVIKIDRSFIRDMTEDEDDAAIVDAILAMSRTLGLRTVAEGVETNEQLFRLRGKGCDGYQGYLASRPVTAAEFVQWFGAIEPRKR